MFRDISKRLVWKLAMQVTIGGTLFFAMATGCKAQECTPDHFTATGVETYEGVAPRASKPVAGIRNTVSSAPQKATNVSAAVTTKSARHARRKKINPAAG